MIIANIRWKNQKQQKKWNKMIKSMKVIWMLMIIPKMILVELHLQTINKMEILMCKILIINNNRMMIRQIKTSLLMINLNRTKNNRVMKIKDNNKITKIIVKEKRKMIKMLLIIPKIVKFLKILIGNRKLKKSLIREIIDQGDLIIEVFRDLHHNMVAPHRVKIFLIVVISEELLFHRWDVDSSCHTMEEDSHHLTGLQCMDILFLLVVHQTWCLLHIIMAHPLQCIFKLVVLFQEVKFWIDH